ncbi:putative cytochrome P450 [Rosa chinensis]|uniref:Putative cytochrome P450 n=1 Tax=Rosa chinensis TaxID=74649 RepID=A0A2P6QDG8_ROSCH|nr:cytochrome P450 94C1 [Rosa chinensis]PRQ32221.1 putative cytochrome P450 [Rosa chinensis]
MAGLESISTVFCFLFFSFTALFSLFSLLVFILRLRPWCNCHVCRNFLTSSWTKDFDNFCDWYTHLLRKSPTGTIHLHVLGNIVTSNPENVEHILKTRFDNYPKGKPFTVILGDLLGRGIFNVDGDTWRFQRKMASLELGSLSVRSHALEVVAAEIHSRLIPLLASVSGKESNGGVLDLQDVFRRFSFDNICKFSFGLDPGCLEPSLPASKFADAFDLASKLSAERAMTSSPVLWKIKRFFNAGSEKQLKEAVTMIDDLAKEMIRQRREMGFGAKNDLLSRFMATVDDDKYLRDIVVSFLLAGRDTISSGLTSLFYLLSQHPEVTQAIREESDRVMGRAGATPSFEQMREMHYLHAVLYETMRLFPPVQFDSKFCQEDDVLPDGTFVKSGTRVTYHPYAMGRMESIWGPDCLDFKPERWLKNGIYSPESSYRYPVFQAGERVCLGKELALVEMKCVAVALIRRFDIQVSQPGQAPRFAPGLTATVRGGLPVRVEEREG